MRGLLAVIALAVFSAGLPQTPAGRPKFDAFDVATIKLESSEEHRGTYIRMDGTHRFLAQDYSLKGLIAAAYDLNAQEVSGGPSWTGSDDYNIVAITPGDVLPSHEEQMAMLRRLLTDRFQLSYHREPKELSIYVLEVAKGGSKLRTSQAAVDKPSELIGQISTEWIRMPGRNATMREFAALLQRAILDRPVVDKTGLTGRYDFDLEWTPDDSQEGTKAPPIAEKPPLSAAMQEQLGLRLESTKGPVDVIVIDHVERPSEN